MMHFLYCDVIFTVKKQTEKPKIIHIYNYK
ncbi:MAG: hypothetical protein ACFWTN_11480 [Clostridium sp.]